MNDNNNFVSGAITIENGGLGTDWSGLSHIDTNLLPDGTHVMVDGKGVYTYRRKMHRLWPKPDGMYIIKANGKGCWVEGKLLEKLLMMQPPEEEIEEIGKMKEKSRLRGLFKLIGMMFFGLFK